METIDNLILTGERARFMSKDLIVTRCIFKDGESPLKESKNLDIYNSEFQWKYPLWYCSDVRVTKTKFSETARSGVWYTKNIQFIECDIDAPKTFRRSSHISLKNVRLPNASETFWKCDHIVIDHISAKGDYFGFNCEDVEATDLYLDGNYCFDGAKNVVIRNSALNSKDSFWNCENVTVINSIVNGEYLAWNCKNLTLINCKIISHQGLCYIKGLKMINCELIDSDLCFEFCSEIDADLTNDVLSIKNPISGRIKAKSIKDIIIDEDIVNKKDTKIIIGNEEYGDFNYIF